MTATSPHKLRTRATIGIFSPSEPLTSKRRDRVDKNVQALKTIGFEVKFGRCFAAATGYTAGTPEERASDFNDLVADPEVDALMAAWGGKSSAHLLPLLNYDSIAKAKRPICAFSDGCVLLNAILKRSNLITFYGPNVVGKLDESEFGDLSQLRGQNFSKHSSLIKHGNDIVCLVPGTARGTLFGGNLSSYVLGVNGNQYEPEIKAGIFFWESGNKTAQELDTLLTSFRLSEMFERVTGMIVGDIKITDDDEWGVRSLRDIVLSTLGDTFPVLHAPVFGHRKLSNPAIPIGCLAELNADNGSVKLLQDPCVTDESDP